MGIVQELRERGVGDFGRPVAFLTLFALNANSAFADGRCEAVACVEVVEERNTLRDEVEIIFYEPTTSRWWKCPLDTQIGPDDFVPLGRNRQERIMARYGTIGQEITSGQITRLNECKDPSRSALTPERYYNDDAPSITQKVVDSVLSAQ